MLLVGFHVLRVDEDVIKVHDNTDVQHVGKDGVDKSLECCGSISETEGNYQPFIRPIVGVESCFPLVSGRNPDKMVCMLEIYLGVGFGPAGGVQKVRDQGKWVAILFGNFIEASEVNAELESVMTMPNLYLGLVNTLILVQPLPSS